MSPALPPAFVSRMRAQLGEEADAYFAALERPYLRGLRLNPQKPVSEAALEAVGGAVPVQIAPQRGIPWHRPLHAAHSLQRRLGDGLLRIQAQSPQIRSR